VIRFRECIIPSLQGTITAVDISAARLGAVRSAAAAAAVPAHMVRCVAGDLVHLAPEQLLPPSFSVDNSQPSVIEDSSSSSSRPSAASSRSQTSRTASSSSPASASQGVLYDRVLVDAPCSGSGVLAKRADLRWRRQAEDMPQLLSAQSQLLGAAAALVRPGGALVYSTCRCACTCVSCISGSANLCVWLGSLV
jgi:16S rRNA (cytosine967-C5)-methyltransferase